MNNAPLSPIIDGYENPLNSEGVTQGFITSTPVNRRCKSPSVLTRMTFKAQHLVERKS